MSDITVSVVIPTYNAGLFITECLDSVYKQETRLSYEVIIIDSGSHDRTLSLVKDYPVNLREITNDQFNHGETRNLGVQIARGDYIIFLTQDAKPGNTLWMQHIIDNFQDDTVSGVYCRQIPRKDADVLTQRNLNNYLTGRCTREVSYIKSEEEYYSLEPARRLALCTFDNVCSALRKTTWKNIPFEKTHFAEDLEWGKKAILAGHKLVYEPDATVIHSHDRSALYEYKRTYLCHRKLYELHGLCTIPTLNHALYALSSDIRNDVSYVYKADLPVLKKLALFAKIPFLSIARVYGQYKGAKDEKIKKPISGKTGV